LLLTPILTVFLTPKEYGYLGIATIIIGLLRVFIGLNPALFVIAKYSLMSKEDLADYLHQIFLITAITLGIAVVCFLAFLPILEKQYLLDFISILILCFTAAFTVIEALILAVIQMEKKAGRFFLFSLFSALLQIVFVIITVLALHWGWRGKIIGDLFASLLSALALMFYLRSKDLLRIHYSMDRLRVFAKFSMPMLPHSVSLWAMNFIDRFFLERYADISTVGVYTVAYNFGLGMSLLYDALQRTWQPHFYEHIQKEDLYTKAIIVRYTWFYYLGTIILWAISVFFVNYIAPFLIGKEFLQAVSYIPLIFLGYTFQGMYRAVASYLYHINKNSILALITLLSAILNIVLDIALISRNGAVGAAQATCLTYLFSLILVQVAVMKLYYMPWFNFNKIIHERSSHLNVNP